MSEYNGNAVCDDCAKILDGGNVLGLPPQELVNVDKQPKQTRFICVESVGVFYTINPDPLRKHNKVYYNDMDIKEQRSLISRVMKETILEVYKELGVNDYSMHFELTKMYNVHCHGVLTFYGKYSGYNYALALVSKKVHNKLGRPKQPAHVCCKVEWIKDKDKICEYLNKEKGLEPIHGMIYKKLDSYTNLE